MVIKGELTIPFEKISDIYRTFETLKRVLDIGHLSDISDIFSVKGTIRLLDYRTLEFKLSDGFVIAIHCKPGIAFESVGGVAPHVTPQVAPQVRKFPAALRGHVLIMKLTNGTRGNEKK
jgi:hypothetical protein